MKEYMTPEMEVVELKNATPLLAGSTEGSGEGEIEHGEGF